MLDRTIERDGKEHRLEWFRDEVVGAGANGGDGGVEAAERGHDDDGDVAPVDDDPLAQLEPIHALHVEVGDDDREVGRLEQLERLLSRLARHDLEVAFAESGNWDHHANEGPQIANRLDDFAGGIAAFAQDLGDHMADVVVLTMSEFGRTVAENGARGTDHGHGNAMLLLGGNVKGGKIYGKWPGLEREQRYEGRDLAITTDFRDIFSEALRGHLGAKDTSRIFPGLTGKARLGIL